MFVVFLYPLCIKLTPSLKLLVWKTSFSRQNKWRRSFFILSFNYIPQQIKYFLKWKQECQVCHQIQFFSKSYFQAEQVCKHLKNPETISLKQIILVTKSYSIDCMIVTVSIFPIILTFPFLLDVQKKLMKWDHSLCYLVLLRLVYWYLHVFIVKCSKSKGVISLENKINDLRSIYSWDC